MYHIVGPDGTESEPVDIDALQVMAYEGKLLPQQMLHDPISGHTLPAETLLGSQVVFPAIPPTPQAAPPPPSPAPEAPPAPQQLQMPALQAQPAVDTSLLGLRLGAYIIDGICSIPLAIPAFIPFIGILFAPLLGLYWMSRDSFFGGQSVGKKVLGLKVVRLDGQPVDWVTSLQRNIVYTPIVLAAIPLWGTIFGGPIMGLINIAELVAVLSTGRRIGDHIAKTVVVRA